MVDGFQAVFFRSAKQEWPIKQREDITFKQHTLGVTAAATDLMASLSFPLDGRQKTYALQPKLVPPTISAASGIIMDAVTNIQIESFPFACSS